MRSGGESVGKGSETVPTLSRRTLVVAGICVGLTYLVRPSRGVWTWLVLATDAAFLAFLAASLARRLPERMRSERLSAAISRAGVVGCSMLLVMAVFELGLAIHEDAGRTRLAAGDRTYPFLTLPPELDRQWLPPIDGRHAYMWLGKLHVVDGDLMRRTTPVPPRRPDVCRIMVAGDSNTFGQAVAVEDVYASVLERSLQATHRVEVLNVGVKGLNSADVLARVTELLPRLEPDLVVYGVCLNDYLESGAGIERAPDESGLWDAAIRALDRRTRAVQVINRSWGKFLISIGAKPALFENELRRMDVYGPRFARDVAAMNRVVVSGGRPPLVAMVVNQFPATSGTSFELTMTAERMLREAGADVVGTSQFLAENDGRALSVGRFDGHPDEEAHRLFAAMLERRLREHPALQRFRR